MRYRNIHVKVWTDDRFPFIGDNCQLTIFHLLTTPLSTPFGLYRASLPALAAEKRWSEKRYRNAFKKVIGMGFVKYDETHHVVFIPNFLKYNPPKSPNVLKSWGKVFKEIPDTKLKTEFLYSLEALIKGLDEGFQEAYEEAFGKAMPIQEQEQEQEQLTGAGAGNNTVEQVTDFLNLKANTSYKTNTKKTKELINARIKEGYTLDDFKNVINKKIKSWGNDPKMSRYLRPETLFGNKFESYLNEKEVSRYMGIKEAGKEIADAKV